MIRSCCHLPVWCNRHRQKIWHFFFLTRDVAAFFFFADFSFRFINVSSINRSTLIPFSYGEKHSFANGCLALMLKTALPVELAYERLLLLANEVVFWYTSLLTPFNIEPLIYKTADLIAQSGKWQLKKWFWILNNLYATLGLSGFWVHILERQFFKMLKSLKNWYLKLESYMLYLKKLI